MLSMLLQVWVRGEGRTLARLASPRLAGLGTGFGRRARDVRVNGPSKSDATLAITRRSFADLFCHFESVTDFTRGILGTCNRLGFWDVKNPSGSVSVIIWLGQKVGREQDGLKE
jgi:hypothetical protein